ncbi:MAG: chitinase [Actinomycetota bacterium]
MSARSDRPRRRVSLVRLVVVLAGLGLAGLGLTRYVSDVVAASDEPDREIHFAPYVDTTLTPLFHFEDPAVNPVDEVILGFVVADPADGCRPTWGTFYDLDAAGRALDLDRRIVRLRERGGDVAVSFGGALNDELAVSCTDPDLLHDAYLEVIDRYDLTTIDFDVEGPAVVDTEANRRRAEVIARLQEDRPELEVWLTLPIAPSGLLDDAVAVLDATLEGGVDLSGVNAMVMNYGTLGDDTDEREANESALRGLFVQLDSAYRRAGTTLTDAEVWSRISATPMIGQNDVAGEVFELSDAHALVDLAEEVGIGQLSMWSANRDAPCGPSATDGRVSNTCSGVDQDLFEFAAILSSATPAPAPAAERADGDRVDSRLLDDPRTSPYPLWRSSKEYVEGDKVVWQGRVYEAKWYSLGEQPDTPVDQVWETPWRYLGPVLDIDREAVQRIDRDADEVPVWSAERVYVAGDQIRFGNEVFQARWWTQGDQPDADPDQAYDHPWIYQGEIELDEEAD